ncbi:MAG: hypothetical protein LUG51_02660 [Tannerellaceae bacterium]|nr:hypothetical protein [Tannerellaceae bacterium]
MSEHNFDIIEQELRLISEMLLLNGTLTECPGLVHGKMGIAVFFFHFAQYTDNMLFSDYALDLIIEIQNQLHANSRADYEKGVAGIGIGIDYLTRNDFLDIEDDIFEDLDERMYRAVMYDPWPNFTLYEGLIGYGKYWTTRLRQQPQSIQAKECLRYMIERIEDTQQNIPAEEQPQVYHFLYDLHEILGWNLPNGLLEYYWELVKNTGWNSSRLGNSAISNIIGIYQRKQYFKDVLQDKMNMALTQISKLKMENPLPAMGLLTGYAGEGLVRLTALDAKNVSWMQLL